LLAGHDAPGFVADVDEDVVAAWRRRRRELVNRVVVGREERKGV
jgi:hypothetical protein